MNKSGYETITTTQLLDWQKGLGSLPEKPMIVSFDDGYQSSIVNGTPIMDLYGYVGVIGIITGSVPLGDSGDKANWTLLQSVVDKGWEINAHSVNHLNMTNFSATFDMTNVTYELNQSRWDIYNNLGIMPKYFVYPYNARNSTIDNECAKYYEICSASSSGYIYKTTNNTHNEFFRKGLWDSHSNESILDVLDIYQNSKLKYNLNENSGTIAHDVSGNGNDGTIDGATWNDDGVDVALTEDVDYSISTSTGLFTILNDDFQWRGIDTNWVYDYQQRNAGYEDTQTIISGLAGGTSWLAIILVVGFAAIVISILINNFENKEDEAGRY